MTVRTPFAVLLAVLATACGGGDSVAPPPPPPPPPAPTISLSAPTVDLRGLGTEATLTATASAGSTVSWTTDQPTIATVTASGSTATVRAIAAGTATITASATVGSQHADAHATVTVSLAAKSIGLTPTSDSVIIGQSRAFVAAVTADPGISTAVQWRSSAPAIATVDGTGSATGVSAGTATITALLVADTTIRATATLKVVTAPVGSALFANWTGARIGVVGGQVTDGLAQSVASLSATTALAGFWAFGDGTSPNFDVAIGSGGATDVTPGGGTQPVFSVSSAEPNVAFGLSSLPTGQAWRWNGSAWSPLAGQPGSLFLLQGVGSGKAMGWSRSGTAPGLQLWDGTAWSSLVPLTLVSGTTPSLLAISPSAAAYSLCLSGTTYELYTWTGGAPVLLPTVPGLAANACPYFVAGTAVNNLWAIPQSSPDRTVHWNGTAWNTVVPPLVAGEKLTFGTTCQGQVVVSTDRGRVYQWNGSAFQRLGTDAETLPNRFFGVSSYPVSCATDGTIRVAGGEGAVARWSGSAWVVETFAPSLRSVQAVNLRLAWAAGGAHSVYRWNGTQWSLAYRAVEDQDRRVGSIAAWADGKMIGALWSSITPLGPTLQGFKPQGILRYDGANWIRDNSAALQLANGVWGPSYAKTFAATGDGNILRFDGSSWSPAFSAGFPLLYLAGTDPLGGAAEYALAVGQNFRTVRWDGTSWAVVGGNTPNVAPHALYVAGPNDAWVASISDLYHFDGTSWTLVNAANAGGSTQTWALFGIRGNEVYAVRGPSQGPRRLYQWNGTQWNAVPGFVPGSAQFAESGSAVQGRAMLVGNNGMFFTSTYAIGLRAPRPSPVRRQ